MIYLSTYPPRWIVDNLLINGWWKTQIVDKWISHPHSQSYQQLNIAITIDIFTLFHRDKIRLSTPGDFPTFWWITGG